MKFLNQLGSITQTVINFLDGLKRASKTLEAFASALKLFEEERKKIWNIKPKEKPKENEKTVSLIPSRNTE
ncbi:hypothetical protein [Tenacibaculum jejuense]|uniref:hypothetical protein n=1 Tax=Tenacibaculum jejuense TaxID=584609 RepID=UPI0012FD2DB6|nr:hypothetical protein [Tenacibaculum jejuense]